MNGELVDLHGQPLRQSMGYSGGGTGFGGQLAEWLPAPESADVALLPSIQLGTPVRMIWSAITVLPQTPLKFIKTISSGTCFA